MARILLVEDNAGDVVLLREALNQSGLPHELTVLEDGEAAIDCLNQMTCGKAPLPEAILLDLNMPKMDGFSVLEFLKADPKLAGIPVVVLSSSLSPRDAAKAEDIARGLYITKPADLDAFLQIGTRVKEFLETQSDCAASSHA